MVQALCFGYKSRRSWDFGTLLSKILPKNPVRFRCAFSIRMAQRTLDLNRVGFFLYLSVPRSLILYFFLLLFQFWNAWFSFQDFYQESSTSAARIVALMAEVIRICHFFAIFGSLFRFCAFLWIFRNAFLLFRRIGRNSAPGT